MERMILQTTKKRNNKKLSCHKNAHEIWRILLIRRLNLVVVHWSHWIHFVLVFH
jgi:hypothetical protein